MSIFQRVTINPQAPHDLIPNTAVDPKQVSVIIAPTGTPSNFIAPSEVHPDTTHMLMQIQGGGIQYSFSPQGGRFILHEGTFLVLRAEAAHLMRVIRTSNNPTSIVWQEMKLPENP